MHQSALFITLATVALGASARVTADINTNNVNKNDATIATVNILNPGTLAARSININIQANPNAIVKSESSIVRHPITVELGKSALNQEKKPLEINVVKRLDQNFDNILQKEDTLKLINVDLNRRLDIKTNVLSQENKLTDAHVVKRLDLNIGATTQEGRKLVDLNTQEGHKLINVDLNRRLDVNTNVLNQESNLADAHISKRLDLNIGAESQEGHKLINVDFSRRLDVNANVLNQGSKLADAHVTKRLDLNIGATTQEGHKLVDLNTQEGHKLINVDLNRRLDVNTNVLNQENKLADAHVAKRLDLNIGATTQEGHKLVDLNTQEGRKLINVDLNRRLDVNTNVLNQENKLADAHVAKRLDLNIGANTQEGHKLIDVNTQEGHKLINVDLNRRLDATILPATDASNPQLANVNLARGRLPTGIEVTRRHLNIHASSNTHATAAQESNSNPIDINLADAHVANRPVLDFNSLLAKEHGLITVDLGNKNTKKREINMSTGYVLDATKVDANGNVQQAVQKRDVDVNVKSDIQHLAARRKDDDDWEDEDDDEDNKVLNETDSANKGNNDKKDTPSSSSASDDKKESEVTGQKKNSASSRSSVYTGLSIMSLLVGTAFLWA